MMRRALAGALAVLAALGGPCGCTPSPAESIGLRVQAPPAWRRAADLTSLARTAPGEVLEAYELAAPGRTARLVFFRTGYTPRTTAAELQVAMRFLVLNLPSLSIRSEGTGAIGGHASARLEVTADGDGVSLAATPLGRRAEAPAGATLVATRQVWIKVPLGPEQGTLEVYFHCPESEFEGVRPDLESALAGVSIAG